MATEAENLRERVEQYRTKVLRPDHDLVNDRQDIAILDKLHQATESVARWMKRCDAQEQTINRLRKRLRDRGIDDT